MDNLILVGFSCSGKTTLGRNVARRLRLNFVDTDRYIEEMTGRTIPEIFREDGESAFRAVESQAIDQIMAEQNQVVSTGGGAFVNPDPPYLQSTGFVLDPGSRVIVSVYSSGAIGRLVPQDVAGLAGYLREHTQAS